MRDPAALFRHRAGLPHPARQGHPPAHPQAPFAHSPRPAGYQPQVTSELRLPEGMSPGDQTAIAIFIASDGEGNTAGARTWQQAPRRRCSRPRSAWPSSCASSWSCRLPCRHSLFQGLIFEGLGSPSRIGTGCVSSCHADVSASV